MRRIVYTMACLASSVAIFAQPCSDLFLSEYIEGSSNNKAIEIYNPTAGSINLAGYELRNFFNGNTSVGPDYVLPLAGIIPAGGTYTVVNPSSNATLLGLADTLTPANGQGRFVANFNGDDAIALYNGTTLIDVIGLIGTDPGTSWVYGVDFNTQNKTLVRKAIIQEGSISWDSTIAINNWNVLAQDDFSDFGTHTMNACSAILDTLVKFSPTSGSVSEASGSATLSLVYNPTSPVTGFSASVVLKSGNAADIGNFTTQTVNFPAGTNTGSVSVTITDNSLEDGNKTFVFALRNPSAGMLLGADSLFTLTVTDDDVVVPGLPVYTIAQVRGTNTDGGPDSLGVLCEVRGTVYGVNTRSTGLQFTMRDGTGGIGVFSPSNTFGYTVNEGDSIRLIGRVSVFRGLSQMDFLNVTEANIIPVGTGSIKAPSFVTALNESTESDLVRIANCTLVDAAQWTGSATGFNVQITDGNQVYTMRIAPNTTAVTMAAPATMFDVIGIGSQFATTTAAPFTDGYQIIPRKQEDILLGGSISENAESASMAVFPNPASERFTVKFEADDNTFAVVALKDLTGRTVMQKRIAVAAGTNQVELESRTAPGVYLVTVDCGQKRMVKRVLIK
jgi:hypothetical protein